MSRAKLDPLHTAALVAAGSLVLYLPVYLVLFGTRLAQLPVADLAIQAIFQGIRNVEKHVIRGSNHSTIFDNTDEHNRVVIDFFTRHSRAGASAAGAKTVA